jgi:hypothetical protein
MERRYLVATLAIIATFAGSSRAFHSLQRMSLLHAEHLQAVAKCESASAARELAKIRTHLHPGYPEEAQLLAEMNVPLAGLQAKIAGADASAAPCARAMALREAERARRHAMRMRADMARAGADISVDPISVQVSLPPDLEQRIQEKTAAVAARMAENNTRLQIAAHQMQMASMQVAESDMPVVEVETTDQTDGGVHTHIQCRVNTRWQQQSRQAIRDAMRSIQNSFTYK